MRYFTHKFQTFSRATLNLHHVHQFSGGHISGEHLSSEHISAHRFHQYFTCSVKSFPSIVFKNLITCYVVLLQCRPQDEIVFSVSCNVQTAKFLK